MRTEDAVRYFGNAAALARALGITRQAVHDWGDTVPPVRTYQIEVVTNGALKAPRPKSTKKARVN